MILFNNYTCLEQQLYVGVLKILPDHLARTVLDLYSKGTQAVSYSKWSEWKANFNQPPQTNICQQTSADLPSHSKNTLVSKETFQETQAPTINLHNILSSGPYGPGVLDYYKKNKKLNDKMRKLLVEAFLHYCILSGCAVTKSQCHSLAMEIKNKFEGEIVVS